ncbi:ead/Ea22-like family protein [Enterobacter kobei]|uniref:ead/Ea22-like family protein n=1 Tax=Enterobacter kobei TaxID=208224 RepID=UPI002005C8FB|nr:ead/Ea22-like family protein [Enterobacter kobei]MCK6822469.1 ead/Ea22-like family protein [Enterobacter kobei]
MSNIDKRALREAAEKAGSDKWQAKKINGDFYVIRNGSYEKQDGITSYQPIAEIEHKPVRDFVAEANPATVLALLDELEATYIRIGELEVIATDYGMKFQRAQDALKHQSLLHKTQMEAAEKLIAELSHHLQSAHAFVEHTEAFGYEASNGILCCGDAQWNIDESKSAMAAAAKGE